MSSSQLIRFALPGFESLLPPSAPGEIGKLSVGRFKNGELTIAVDSGVEGRTCVVLGSGAPPDERLLALTLVVDTLKRLGAARVIALLPYLGYARQDQQEDGRGLAAAWLGQLLRSCGVDELITIDIHSRRAAELLGMPVTSLSPADAFAAEIRRAGLLDATIVAPDEGAIERCQAVAEAAGIEAPVAFMVKERTASGVVHRELAGEVGRRAVVVDDILDTGATLISCCHRLRGRGVQEPTVMVTHGLFTGDMWRELVPLAAAIHVTDSLPEAPARAAPVQIVPVGSLLEEAIAALPARSTEEWWPTA